MDKVVYDIEEAFSKIKFNKKKTYKHPSPKNKSGKSKITDTFFEHQSGDRIVISCYDYSKEHAVNQNHLGITIGKNKFNRWLIDEVYE